MVNQKGKRLMQSKVEKDAKGTVSHNKCSLVINGQPVTILCSSLFYFRIPKGLWKDRLRKVKGAGYNAIDVYVPWNYHETREGKFDFQGEKDLDLFLSLARKVGLYVVIRPGPYICSEWDGGGLPAWLFVKEGIKIRQNDPLYLSYVRKWYEKVIRILKKHQITHNGSIILFQLENELDFFPCHDPKGYISTLRDIAKDNGVAVPLIVCVGQGDYERAGSGVEGVLTSTNLYFIPPNVFLPADNPEVEKVATSYLNLIHKRKRPGIIMETEREPMLIKRLLSVGLKMASPYLQTSGTNLGYWHGQNNWSEPFSFLRTDYDFGGMISGTGTLRKSYYEYRCLTHLIISLRNWFALAEGFSSKDNRDILVTNTLLGVSSGDRERKCVYYLKNMDTYLIFLANLTDSPQETRIKVGKEYFPKEVKLTVVPRYVAILPYNLSLEKYGLPAVLRYSSSEIFTIRKFNDRTLLILYGEESSEGEALLELELKAEEKYSDLRYSLSGSKIIINYAHKSEYQFMVLQFRNGAILEIIVTTKEKAGKFWFIEEENGKSWMFSEAELVYPEVIGESKDYILEYKPGIHNLLILAPEKPASILNKKDFTYHLPTGSIRWSFHIENKVPGLPSLTDWNCVPGAPEVDPDFSDTPWPYNPKEPEPLEKSGIYQGFGWYRTLFSLEKELPPPTFLLMSHGADIICAYLNGRYIGTKIPGGDFFLFEVSQAVKEGTNHLALRTEIWGHSNFDSGGVPSLKLGSVRGLWGPVSLLYDYLDISQDWKYKLVKTDFGRAEKLPDSPLEAQLKYDDQEWKLNGYREWIVPSKPYYAWCRKWVSLPGNIKSGQEDGVILQLENIGVDFWLWVNGNFIARGSSRKKMDVFDISEIVHPREKILIAIFCKGEGEGANGKIGLWKGKRLNKVWKVRGKLYGEVHKWYEENFYPLKLSKKVNLPVVLEQGSINWYQTEFRLKLNDNMEASINLALDGENFKATIFLNGKLIGRLIFSSEINFRLVGGILEKEVYLPEAYLKHHNRLVIIFEAIGQKEKSKINSIALKYNRDDSGTPCAWIKFRFSDFASRKIMKKFAKIVKL